MNKLEYIFGDLVMTNGAPVGTAKGVVYRVVSSNPSKTLELNNGTVLKGAVCLENLEGAKIEDKGFLPCECFAWVKDIVPIPLTVEILKENGWEFTDCDKDEDGSEWFIFSKDGILPDLYYYPADKDFTMVVCAEEVFPHLKFVHQLQHVLWALEINDNMEV